MSSPTAATSDQPSSVSRIRVAVAGTSWWADAMYLPAIAGHPNVELVGCTGRNADRAAAFATKWEIGASFTDHEQMLDTTNPDAVIIATANTAHLDQTLTALASGAHVLCEKPMGLSATEARTMADAATAANAITMVPFTYRWMPSNRWIKRLIDDGFLGRPFHLGLRYFTGFALDGDYTWRFDRPLGGGIFGDIGTHWLYLAEWFFGPITSVQATARTFIEREPRPDGTPAEPVEDSGVLTVGFASGAYGILQVSAVCWEGTPFGQVHEFDAHGDQGTLHAVNDWDRVQEVRGVKRGETGPAAVLPIPDDIWGPVRRDNVHNTYRDVFRTTSAMTREWIDCIVADRPTDVGFDVGARIATILEAALASAATDGAVQALEP